MEKFYLSAKKSNDVKAKKHLGQHFLNDETIAFNIVKAFTDKCETPDILEIGPGMGVLTKYLLQNTTFKTWAIDLDKESIAYLNKNYPELDNRLLEADFLALNFQNYFKNEFSLIGNFPYNISSQIVFSLIDNRHKIPLMVGMFQKEVAERLGAKPRTKDYGILSVITQAYFDVEYLFTVNETVFIPPPKVKSGVVRLIRKNTELGCDPKKFKQVVKLAFNQRRKKLSNAISSLVQDKSLITAYADKRAEELSVQDFVNLTIILLGE
ncbi:MAG: 16S rRNA (adenine(1518)-N(6)/adenine(1519)-N(6))-dimethyltransferase RsmA [Candidatus Methylacidiphilales bacterium]